jgi:large conductance mechanosensitive channel
MLAEFKKFALRGNVVDLAIGAIIGAAFGAIVQSRVEAITGGLDFSNHFLALLPKVTADTLVEAEKQGVVLAWGNSLTINIIIVAFVFFLLICAFNRLTHNEADKAPVLTNQEELLTEIRDQLKLR